MDHHIKTSLIAALGNYCDIIEGGGREKFQTRDFPIL